MSGIPELTKALDTQSTFQLVTSRTDSLLISQFRTNRVTGMCSYTMSSMKPGWAAKSGGDGLDLGPTLFTL
jgi:hypothetical protein